MKLPNNQNLNNEQLYELIEDSNGLHSEKKRHFILVKHKGVSYKVKTNTENIIYDLVVPKGYLIVGLLIGMVAGTIVIGIISGGEFIAVGGFIVIFISLFLTQTIYTSSVSNKKEEFHEIISRKTE